MKVGDLYRLRITLMECRPACVREVEALGSTTLDELHWIVQLVMPWTNSHLHDFSDWNPLKRPEFGQKMRRWSDPQFELEGGMFSDEEPDVDETKTRIDEALREKKDLIYYQYDMGDSWYHEIKVLEISDTPMDLTLFPRCIGGKGICPPDDCGGVWGWEHLQEALADRKNPEHESMREWMGLKEGETIDPNAFDLEEANRALKQMRPKPRKKRKK